jgi:hypothetical protein
MGVFRLKKIRRVIPFVHLHARGTFLFLSFVSLHSSQCDCQQRLFLLLKQRISVMFSMGELVLNMASTDKHTPDAHAPDATTLNHCQKALLSHFPTHKQTIIMEIKTGYCIEYQKKLWTHLFQWSQLKLCLVLLMKEYNNQQRFPCFHKKGFVV